eukprot:SAG25_NODE_2829_length_1366_cov_1.115233_1_plen_259_part_00
MLQGLLLGQGGGVGMTMARQRAALDRFRSGEVNVLLATSVAEEGLDIQQCGLVIRTEPPLTIIQNIQGRGRAQQLDASYVVVVLSDGESEEVARLTVGEDRAWEALQRCIGGAGTGVAATSWSNFDSEQIAVVSNQTRHAAGGGDAGTGTVDWKSRLNVFLQQRDRPAGFGELVCTYDAARYGAAHAPSFVATVTVSGVVFEGERRPTKKASEQTAAYAALGNLTIDAGSLQLDPTATPAWMNSYDTMSEESSSDDSE